MINIKRKVLSVFACCAAALVLTVSGCGQASKKAENSAASSAVNLSVAQSVDSSAGQSQAASGNETSAVSSAASSAAESSASSSKDQGAGTATSSAATSSAASSEAQKPATPDKDITPVKMYASTSVNMRKGPATTYDILAKVSSGTEVTKNGENGDWSRVEYDGTNGYIKSEYLTDKKPEKTDYSTGKGISGTTFVKKAPGDCLIVIDPGHQAHGNSEKEPDGPGSSTMKAKVATGTSGPASGLAEYQLTLQVSLKLQQELLSRGYKVKMIRTTHDVNISNAERAMVANNANADAFLRIHANGSDDPSVHGVVTACQTAGNPYNANLYNACRTLSVDVLDGLCAATGAKRLYVWEVDNMSGINWCTVPVTIVELGFMTNADEDLKMASEDYQYAMARGMADGVDAFFGN